MGLIVTIITVLAMGMLSLFTFGASAWRDSYAKPEPGENRQPEQDENPTLTTDERNSPLIGFSAEQDAHDGR